jgi:multidrug resistance efflux pump
MKALFNLLFLAALGFVIYDDDAKRTDLAQAQSRAVAAEQQVQSQAQQVQQLTAQGQQLTGQVNQLQSQLNRLTAGAPAPAGSAPGASRPQQPGWFQQRLNGANGVLDPGSARP